jgi:thioredoxin reductase (NADPH)
MSRKMQDILIAGGGIAGLTAALTAARLGCSTLVLSGDMLGGLLISINQIEGFPGFPQGIAGYDLCPTIQEQAEEAGAEFLPDTLTTVDAQNGALLATTASGEQLAARTVILATGAHLRELDIPGFTRLRGRGVSRCASCDGPLLKGRDVAVIGGGDSALQEALTLAESGARVLLFTRDARFTAQRSYIDRVQANPAVTLHFDTEIAEILGDNTVSAVRLNTGTIIDVAGVFAYIGLVANSEPVSDLLNLAPGAFIPTDAKLRTAHPTLFAAGAVRRSWGGRAVLSAADGAAAALAAEEALSTV